MRHGGQQFMKIIVRAVNKRVLKYHQKHTKFSFQGMHFTASLTLYLVSPQHRAISTTFWLMHWATLLKSCRRSTVSGPRLLGSSTQIACLKLWVSLLDPSGVTSSCWFLQTQPGPSSFFSAHFLRCYVLLISYVELAFSIWPLTPIRAHIKSAYKCQAHAHVIFKRRWNWQYPCFMLFQELNMLITSKNSTSFFGIHSSWSGKWVGLWVDLMTWGQ